MGMWEVSVRYYTGSYQLATAYQGDLQIVVSWINVISLAISKQMYSQLLKVINENIVTERL